MKLSLAIISSALLVAVHAANIQFNVIAPSATDVKVSVNGQQVALKASNPSVPYFTGTAETGSATTYKVHTHNMIKNDVRLTNCYILVRRRWNRRKF